MESSGLLDKALRAVGESSNFRVLSLALETKYSYQTKSSFNSSVGKDWRDGTHCRITGQWPPNTYWHYSRAVNRNAGTVQYLTVFPLVPVIGSIISSRRLKIK